MCGRYIYDPIKIFYELNNPNSDEVADYLINLGARDLPRRTNISPTQNVPAVRFDGALGRSKIVDLKWGLIPRWSKDDKFGSKLINARAETLGEKPSFREAFKKRRCLLPATGFYEWSVVEGAARKQIWRIGLKDHAIFCMAGLYENWRSPEGVEVETCTIVTTAANALISPIHERMPAILHFKDFENWLDPSVTDTNKLSECLIGYDSDNMERIAIEKIGT
ncbi:MAG: SOS response-associated peptidase [Planctomycetes bacterium]|nr:SOS response-associated peptidase [Planctomycetota bacterium]